MTNVTIASDNIFWTSWHEKICESDFHGGHEQKRICPPLMGNLSAVHFSTCLLCSVEKQRCAAKGFVNSSLRKLVWRKHCNALQHFIAMALWYGALKRCSVWPSAEKILAGGKRTPSCATCFQIHSVHLSRVTMVVRTGQGHSNNTWLRISSWPFL